MWFILQTYRPMARLQGIPFGKQPCRRSTTPSSRTRIGIWFFFLQEGIFLDVDGSTGIRAQQTDRLADRRQE
jgi:hypothetical protein